MVQLFTGLNNNFLYVFKIVKISKVRNFQILRRGSNVNRDCAGNNYYNSNTFDSVTCFRLYLSSINGIQLVNVNQSGLGLCS